MNAEFRRVKELFLAAVEKPDPAERDAYVHEVCGHDEDLRRQVDALLGKHAQAGSFLESPAPQLGATVDEQPVSERPGAVIGPYKLLEQIGEGGFGVVFMAEQTQPVRRMVALKILKPGMDTRQVVARFEAERQALALMDHPYIAHVLDGGETATGRPYFIMELVRGIPITEFCDQNGLPVRERLQLLVDVCRAVQHAHQKGVIHRDLKPSNVMVTLHDATPVVKVIDFGIAKATGQQLTEKTLFTNFAQMIGTPLYMSPEQAQLNGLDIDTRTDIYALGVLLYELLTGTTPLDQERLRTVGYDEIRRLIREEEPPKPSTRIGTLGQAATAVSANRQSDPNKLSQLCRGELDWIVMRCLEKDRNRRYETASDFALDLQRYLADEPVLACPPSPGYRLRKLVRRNKRAVATVAFLILVLLVAVGAVAGTLGWAVRDRDARTAALEQKAHLAFVEAERLLEEGKYPEALSVAKRAEGLLASGASEVLRAKVQTLRKDLAMVLRLEEIRLPKAVGRVERPRDAADADAAYADAFREYGLDIESLEPSQAAAAIRGKPIRLELSVALDAWASKRRSKGPVDEPRWKRLIAVARAADPDEWRNRVRDALERRDPEALRELAASPQSATLPLQAFSMLGEAIRDPSIGAALLRQAQQKYPDDFWINFQLAWSLERMQPPRIDEAIRFYSVAKALRPRNAPIHVFLGIALHKRNRLDEALVEHRKATHLEPDYAIAHYSLGAVFRDKGRLDEAVAAYREAIRLLPTFPHPHLHLAGIANQRGQWQEAIGHASQVIDLKGDEARARCCRGHAYLHTGQWDKAAADLATGLSSGPVDDAWTQVACLRLLAGDTKGYQELCRQLSQRLEKEGTSLAAYFAGRVFSLSPHSPAARSQAVRWAERNVADRKTAWNLHALGLAHYRAGEFTHAIQRCQESLQVDADWQGHMLNWLVLAMARHRLGQGQEAAQWLDKSVQWRAKLPQGKDDTPIFPTALPTQDWLEFLVLFREAQAVVKATPP